MAWTQKTKSSPSGSEKRAAKSKSTPKSTKSPTRSRNNKQKSRRAKAPTPKYDNNQRSNLPSEVSKPKAVAKPKATRRVATPIKSTAKTKPLARPKIVSSPIPVAKAKITKSPTSTSQPKPFITSNAQRIDPKEEVAGKGPAPIIAAPKPAASINYNTDDATETTKSKQSSTGATAIKPGTGVQAKAPVKQAKPLLSVEPTNLPARNYGAFDNSTYQANAKAGKDSVMPTVSDKYRNDDVSYNQAYWAAKKAGGASQADMKTQQDSIGIKKAYSGDKVITEDMKRKASDDLSRITGSMAVLDESGDPEMTAAKKADLTKAGILVGGVTKTKEQSGLFGEKLDTTYNYKGGPSIVTRATDPTIKGVRLGDKTSTTFVNGVEVATKTGSDPLGRDAKVTRPKGVAKGINDRVEAGPDPIKEISDIDNQIKTETDPGKLKALYKRRLMLMRMNQTNTRFAGLLGDADTKRTNLMSIG